MTQVEIVGWDEVGEDDEEIVGGGGNGGGRKVRADQLPQSIVGIPLTTIPLSSTGVVIQVPLQRNIRPDRLVLDRVQAQSALIYQMSIGTTNLLANGNPIPGDMFSPDSVCGKIRAAETATPSVGLTLIVGNRTATAITSFTAAIVGPSTKA
jgi:hypothetical protein